MVKNEKVVFEKNAFDILRYWAAFSVMIGHYVWNISKITRADSAALDSIGRITSFFPGVVVLFAICGFLISASYERSHNRKEFFKKRVLRMYPELWVCTIVNFILICVLAYELIDKGIFVWLITQFFGIANTPSCLKGFATGSINGSLWTIFTQVQFYIVLGFIYQILKKMNIKKWLLFLGILALCNVVSDFAATNFGGIIGKLIERFFLSYALWFFIGVFCYVKREWVIPRLKKVVPVLLILYLVASILPIKVPGYYANIIVGVLLPFIVIGVGYCLPKIRLKCDLSYEIFLYHWIVLNVIIDLGLVEKIGWLWCFLVFLGITILISWISWRLVGNGRSKGGKTERIKVNE